jgi:ABC-2 type transport system permease protein
VRLAWVHTRAATIELARYPSFSVPTMLFPAVLFLVWGARGNVAPNVAMASYAAFAVLGVAFFQFGVGIAAERASPWQLFLRVLPASPAVRFVARVASALLFALGSATLVVVAAAATTAIELPPARWAALAATLLAGGIPFALLGIAIGYWLSPRGALPAANLLFLSLAYLGGMLGGAQSLPGRLAELAPVLPTRLWAELLAASVGVGSWRLANIAGLAVYAAGFALLAAWGYRRDEGERFR